MNTTSSTPAPSIHSRNPATGEIFQDFPELSPLDVEGRIAAAEHAYRENLKKPLIDVVFPRARVLEAAAKILESRADELARIITLEMGKTLAASKAEVLKCAKCCRFYAEHGIEMLKPEQTTLSTGSKGEILYEPMGIVLAIMPWNFPFWQVFRCAAPILLSGNSMILKHASNVPESALAIETIWHEAFRQEGLDPLAFATLLIPASRVSGLIEDQRIRGVTLTGSEAAGRSVAETAGRCLKKTVLELGGSDPFIVFPTADLDRAIETAAQARMLANGQSCIAAKRFIVHESLYDQFREGLMERFSDLRIGDPLEPSTQLGPLSMSKIREDLHALVEDARARGAAVRVGGELPTDVGYYYPPTVVENIPESARLFREEAFGPVASLYRFQTTDEAIRIANATTFGLGASIWTENPREVELCARLIESGQIFVNEMVASDPAVPFGGMKDSGYGRELGTYGVREWTITRTLVISQESRLNG